MKPRQRIFILIWLLALAVVVCAQDIYPISGGGKTEQDPNNKKLIRFVAENERVRVIVGRSDKWKNKKARMIVIQVKVENLSDEPLNIHTSKFNAVDEQGRAYAGLETDEAIKRFNDTHAIAMNVFTGPLRHGAVQQRIAEDFRRAALSSGNIPPHSFKEGVVFFEAPERQHYTLKITLANLWPEAFVFSTEKSK